ncbi:hypothetical protein [Leisingera sp. M523]|uniref:hypothetical protein n=1 Tax=Leisingera sp. M523 TaxID=2867013 RepID=UPI0021A853E8|nr:hypothetical protein [Leisingera sp. M523]UWQ29242.1 hypothetical protein K3557_01260 [Leisingera sp. M523]
MSQEYTDIARVVQVIDEWNIVLNKGARDGISEGQRFLIFELGDEIIDPENGESLGRLEVVKGRVEVIHVQNAMSTVRSAVKVDVGTRRKIYSRPSKNSLNYLALATLGGKEEEIIEDPEQTLAEVDAKIGSYAKLI